MEMNDTLRVKYYSPDDLSVGFHLKRVEYIISNFSSSDEITEIDDAIELFNVQQLVDNCLRVATTPNQTLIEYGKVTNEFSAAIGKYFSNIKIDNLSCMFESMYYDYRDDFWVVIEKYGTYERISEKVFDELVSCKHFRLKDVLECKKIVNRFSMQILEFMELNPNSAEIFIEYFLSKYDGKREKLYFPKELSNDKKLEILDKYLSSESPNLNYLKLIYESYGTNDLMLTDHLRLKAKRRYKDQVNRMFEESNGFTYGAQVHFNNHMDEYVRFDINEERVVLISYNSKWISENLDYSILLIYNFLHLFGFTDGHFRSKHVSLRSQLSVFESAMGLIGNKEYQTGISFKINQMIADVQMKAYCELLKTYDIYLEDLIEWYFDCYLKDEFNIVGFKFNKSSRSTSYLEKCRHLAAEMDSILKQFMLYCKNRAIDWELFYMSTEHIFIRNIPSMLDDKYIYACGEEIQKVSSVLFSDQSILTYIPKLGKEYSSFYELIESEKLYYDMLEDYQKEPVDWLIENSYVLIDHEDRLKIDKVKVTILYDLYENEVSCFHYWKEYENVIREFEQNKMIYFESTLFTKPEQDYYNYLFNKSDFSNGLDLRNRYMHGTQVVNEADNEKDYYVFLRMIILIIIKMNEEFCLKYPKVNE